MLLQQDLIEARDLHSHLGKKLSMLSAGSRRKVALVGLLASGATVTCLDQPFADYEADARLPWRRQVALTPPGAGAR